MNIFEGRKENIPEYIYIFFIFGDFSDDFLTVLLANNQFTQFGSSFHLK